MWKSTLPNRGYPRDAGAAEDVDSLCVVVRGTINHVRRKEKGFDIGKVGRTHVTATAGVDAGMA
jgi:hypothetical protein